MHEVSPCEFSEKQLGDPVACQLEMEAKDDELQCILASTRNLANLAAMVSDNSVKDLLIQPWRDIMKHFQKQPKPQQALKAAWTIGISELVKVFERHLEGERAAE